MDTTKHSSLISASKSVSHRLAQASLLLALGTGMQVVHAGEANSSSTDRGKAASASTAVASAGTSPTPKAGTDHTGRTRRGNASFYAQRFAGRKMADGTRMDPNANIAASKTLPLGTTAKVTNLRTGKAAIVEIRDRGPYVDGRIVDLAPKVAHELGMTEDGVAPVTVAPIEVPLPDGTVKQGDAAREVASAQPLP